MARRLPSASTFVPVTLLIAKHVLPLRPQGTDGLGEAELAALDSRDCLVGAALPQAQRT